MEQKQTAVEYLVEQLLPKALSAEQYYHIEQAKELDKQQHKKFNDFLQEEIELGISDKATIERIEWYYNTYFINNEQQ